MSTLAPVYEPTIRDLEQTIEHIFDRVRSSESSITPDQALQIISDLRNNLAPSNFRAVVQLEDEDGRKKRSTASAKNWGFESGQIRLYFEPDTQQTPALAATQTTSSSSGVVEMPSAAVTTPTDGSTAAKLEIQQCCEALAQAERAGKQFIALKWFRDLVLAGLSYAWAKDTDERQRVLSAAIDSGAILIKKIPNPRSPMHPTTTLSLNKSTNVVAIPSRFKPIPISGGPASETLLKDRGSY